MKPITEFFKLLRDHRKIVITTHANPDADALGSSLALWQFLVARGHDAVVISPTDYPEFLSWMPGEDKVMNYEADDRVRMDCLIAEAEIIFCLDFAGINRIKNMAGPVADSKAIRVLVDHHLDPDDFTDYGISNTKAGATAELLYDFMLSIGSIEEITPQIADCLYAGIMTDTGSFRFPATTSKIHRIVADLIDQGANVSRVSREIYDTNSENRMRFVGYALLEKLTVKKDLGIAYFVISAKDYDKFELKQGDTEGLVNYALSIKGIVMASIIIEKEEEIRLSFRSVGNYAVNLFANQHFCGGGHKNASGGSSKETLAATVERFEGLLPAFKIKYLLQA